MESINTFSNGMSSDLSKQMQSKDTYLQALNFRALTEAGGSNGALVNIKGNECAITFPDLQPVFKLQLIKGTNPVDTSSNTATFDINGTVVNNLTIDNNTRGIDIYNFITENYPNCYQYTGSTVATKTFAIAYEDDYVVFYNQPVYEGCSPVASVPTEIDITYSDATDSTRALLFFINSDGINTLVQNITNPYVAGVPRSLIIPIGSTFILDDIYILTATDNPTYGPAGAANEIPENDKFMFGGAIWKLVVNPTGNAVLTLIYSSNIDFTKYHPVAPSAILGRYESPNIQRLYWTDFYNKIRTINVAQPQLMAMSPAQLYVFPSVSFEIPLLHNIGAGSLSYGTYELAYRLKKAGGAVTNYSQTSNMVHLIGEDPNVTTAASYKAYEGGPGPNTRSITWKVSNLDTSYDTVEYIILYRTSKTAIPLIYVKPEISIGLLTDNYVTIDNLSTYDTILLEDFLNLSTGFTHAKTVDTKDNRLFWGNVKYAAQSDISGIFDARAFRTKTSGTTPGAEDIYLSNNGAAPAPYFLADAIALPQTEDCINEYYDTNGDESANACFYRPNTTRLGGEGKYISYEFGTEEILLSDLAVTRGNIADGWLIRSSAPFSNQAGISGMNNPEDLIITSSDSDNQTYPIKGVGGFKNPYVTSLMKGFQHEEIYRIGIQFFDKQGNPFFTEWVGDIKMPSTANHNDNPGPVASSLITPVTDFRNSFLGDDDAVYGQILYIKFEIDISSIKDFIGGYQMVRVERTAADKTILGSGMITNSFSDGTAICLGGGLWTNNFVPFPGTVPTVGAKYDPYPSQDSLETLGHTTSYDTSNYTPKVVTFDCFDMINDNGDGYSYRTGDKLLVRSRVKPINRQRAMALADDCRYRLGFDTVLLGEWLDNTYGTTRTDLPSKFNSVGAIGFNPSDGKFQTGFDSNLMPYYILHYVEEAVYNSNSSLVVANRTNHNVTNGQIIAGGNVDTPVLGGGVSFRNYIYNFGPNADFSKPGYGSKTVLLEFNSSTDAIFSTLFGCSDTGGEKLMGLYYRPNTNQYGGNTYAARTNNTYIACGSFIPITRGTSTLDNNLSLEIKCYGGDIHLNYWDHQKIHKSQDPTVFKHYRWDNGLGLNYKPGHTAGLTELADFTISNTFCFPCTNTCNQGVRHGWHVDSDLTDDTKANEDDYKYYSYHSNEKNVATFFPKPLNFQLNDVWRNRVFFSELKFDNEIEDSWTKYLPDSFYDVEGNYGQIMALVSLKESMYFFQERGVGLLMINPVSMVNDSMGQNVKLGESDKTIQKHFYRAIDTGTSHQWSVYRSQGTISFVDVRHKKIYLFNGESVTPISDIKGQRNFTIKRLHNELLKYDNPIIDKGVLTTYDYYHNEFLYTFNNKKLLTPPSTYDIANDENLTLAYSEVLSAFTGMYSFTPNLYINSNKHLLSTNRANKIWLHNYGTYGNFYDTQYPCTLKILFNEQPMYTKVLDNLVWMSESVNDNNLWNDDLNIYPGSSTLPTYPDDVNKPFETFDKVRIYNQYQNTDWTTLTLTHPTNNLRKVEQGFNLQVPRNKFNYDTNSPSTYSLFDPSRLTKTTFGERMRDKWAIIDLYYKNTANVRFIIHNLKSIFRISDR